MKLEDIMLDPAKAFDAPADVLNAAELDREQKVKVLHRWEYDARQLLVAEAEGMNQGSAATMLQQVLEALDELGAEPGIE